MRKRILLLFTMVFVFACSSLVCANMEMGMSGAAVQRLQYMLIDAGYLSDGADGVFGAATRDAVTRFQAAKGLAADGVVGTRTLTALAETGKKKTNNSAQNIWGKRRMIMHATAYSAQDPGNTGITARGHRLKRGIVSVDPSIIPLGTKLYIEGYGYAVADDTGGAIVGKRIDLGMDSNREALRFGRRNVVVHVL